ncbi:MarR family transcriptional regulator [Candidatus Woesearchaeota archaeon]|nr:MarR family transcriptional regulator [Candidatus Woesearchaeota archaeon]
MKHQERLRNLEGLHTVETVAQTLHLTRQSTLNLLSQLKKEGYVTTSGGGKQKRLYRISLKKQRPRDVGMFDIINRYSPMKIQPWYDHQVHGLYGPEEALIDALQTRSFRVILASMRLFGHITHWSTLYRLAKERDCWQKVGALYEVARMFFRVRKMPKNIPTFSFFQKIYLIPPYPTTETQFYPIDKKWKVAIPFRKGDIQKVLS